MSESPKDKKEKKKLKNQAAMETLGSESAKSKKESKLKKENKKRKALEIDDDEERSETSSELGEPVNAKAKSVEAESKKKKKKAKAEEEEEDVDGGEEKSEEHPNAISKFRISAPLKAKLKEKGIESLFPIQAMTLDTILDGSDLVGRARTGQVILISFRNEQILIGLYCIIPLFFDWVMFFMLEQFILYMY